MRSKILFSLIVAGCCGTVWLLSLFYKELLDAYEHSTSLKSAEYSWFFRLLLNLVGYSTILLPAYIIYKYLDRIKYFERVSNPTCTYRVLFACFGEPGERLEGRGARDGAAGTGGSRVEFAFCFSGLMTAYLIWGLLQEKIMTQTYELSDGTSVRFSDSQFLVFVNRLLALCLASARLACAGGAVAGGAGGSGAGAPLRQYAYCALSNVVSAWCQYEALKYVSFPTQVLSKSCKVIPVMLMGKLISGNKYEAYEYITAVLISVGMVLFMFGSHDDSTVSSALTVSGACLLAVYLACDSFTASWQGAVFARYRVRPMQMLAGVNLCSCALTAAALAGRADAALSLRLLQNPIFVTDVVMLSLSSALGQLLIYRTISSFGAVVFAIIMTLRQATSILLSCAVYGHAVSARGAVGVLLVFGAALLRVYARRRKASKNTVTN